jgi:hypothetical protein
MERHWHDERSLLKHVGAPVTHQGREPRSHRAPTFVLQRMDDGAKCPVVGADGARTVDARAGTPTPGTSRRFDLHAPGCQRITAGFAKRGREWKDRLPAANAHGSVSRALERLAARGTRRSKDDSENRIYEPRQEPCAKHLPARESTESRAVHRRLVPCRLFGDRGAPEQTINGEVTNGRRNRRPTICLLS